MLHIKFNLEDTQLEDNFEDDNDIIVDVHKAFMQTKLTGTKEEREIIRVIEEGEYLDSMSFKDRFGFKLPIEDLSSGSKAALCTLNFPDKEIDTRECGLNALGAIISICNKGSVIIRDVGIKLPDPYWECKHKIDVECCGLIFTDFDELNTFYHDEFWYSLTEFKKGTVNLHNISWDGKYATADLFKDSNEIISYKIKVDCETGHILFNTTNGVNTYISRARWKLYELYREGKRPTDSRVVWY